MYATTNFKSVKALKEAVQANVEGTGPAVTFYQPSGLFPTTVGSDLTVYLEGPHFPAAHTWAAKCTVDEETKRRIVKVK